MSQSDFVSRGQALVAAGQFQEAVKVCRLGLLGRPTTVEGRVVLGQALLALKRFDEVLAEMRVALELDHSSVPAQVLRAEALLRKGDTGAAVEALHKARQASPGDHRIMQLLGEAEQNATRQSVSHPAVSFVGSGDTKHYPGHTSGSGEASDDVSETENFTKQTSLSSPGGARRSSQRQAAVDPDQPKKRRLTPPPDELDVGDKSGTVEVDPELEGIEMEGDDDLGALAAPPKAANPAAIGGGRGTVRASGAPKDGGTVQGKKLGSKPKPEPTMSLELEDDDDVELMETHAPQDKAAKKPGKGTAVRNAVAMPSGVLGDVPSLAPRAKGASNVPPPRSKPASEVPPPRSKGVSQPPASPLPPAPRAPIAAALPTMAAAQPPPPFVQSSPFAANAPSPFAVPPSPFAAAPPPPSPAANMPTMALNAAQQQTAAAVDQLFGNEQQEAPVWARSTMAVNVGADPRSLAAANEPTARPGELDPAILAMMSGGPQQPGAAALDQISLGTPPKGAMKTGMRRKSRFGIVLWIFVGIAVIGGGVFAGFQIRAMRLKKQIAAARSRATDLAKTDTFGGWTSARDSLAGIVQASPTVDNRAALARARALIAYEFGDGLPEAQSAMTDTAGQGIDNALATAFYGLATSDVATIKASAGTLPKLTSSDPAVLFAQGEIAMFQGDPKAAVTAFKAAADKDPRPLYGVALAKAQAGVANWDEAIAALDRVLAGIPDHPEAVIARGNILAESGRIAPGQQLGNEVRAQLERVIYEGKRPVAEQQHGVSPTELAMGFLALSHVDYARGDLNAARRDLRAAADVNLDDQRFAEESVDTLIELGDYTLARNQIDALMKSWPTSRRARIALANIYIAQGHPSDAIDLLAKAPDALALPDGTVAHGYAQLATGDAINAAADFDAVLKKIPTYEPAVVGRAWIDLANGDVDAATKRAAERFSQRGSSPALTTVYAAALRRSLDPTAQARAKEMLEKVVAGSHGPDVARAQLELARIHRDAGAYLEAKTAYSEAAKTGNSEARLELALIMIDNAEAQAGRTMLEDMLKEAGSQPSGQLVIEAARARMLVGDHDGASQLLELADKMSSVERWKLDRERGRLSLRRSKFSEAASEFARALDTCGSDAETFLLAADVGVIEAAIADKVKKLAPERLKGQPEALIVEGKQLLAAGKDADAEANFKRASQALKDQKASRRRQAQADFGLAIIFVNRKNNVDALSRLDLVIQEDSTLVDAYVFAASITTNNKKAFGLAQTATQLNPDYPYAWQITGQLAAKLNDKRTLGDAIARLQIIAPGGDELAELTKLR